MQVSSEDMSSVGDAVALITQSLERMIYSHRHKNRMGGCDECENIDRLTTALNKIALLANKSDRSVTIKGESL